MSVNRLVKPGSNSSTFYYNMNTKSVKCLIFHIYILNCNRVSSCCNYKITFFYFLIATQLDFLSLQKQVNTVLRSNLATKIYPYPLPYDKMFRQQSKGDKLSSFGVSLHSSLDGYQYQTTRLYNVVTLKTTSQVSPP